MVQSVVRALDLVDLASQTERGVTVAEMAEQLGLKRPTAHNLVRTLVHRGVLERLESPVRYRLGPAVGQWAEAATSQGLVARARSLFLELARRTPQVGWVLTEQRMREVQRLLLLTPDRPGVVQRHRLDPCHPYHAATSLAYQAFCEPEARKAFRAHFPLRSFGAPPWGTYEQLNGFLDESRQRGCVVPPPQCPSPSTRQYHRAAAPVCDKAGVMIAQVGGFVEISAAAAVKRDMVVTVRKVAASLSGCESRPADTAVDPPDDD